MLTIHRSNRLEALVDELARVTREPLRSVFAPETVLVQSRGVARWLSLALSERAGICANVRFPFPNAYAWELYRSVFPDLPEQSPHDAEVLTWRIVATLPDLEGEPLFAPVARYVAGDALRRYELAGRLAQLYDEYLVYRPDWIRTWERGDAPHWQGALWKRLARDAGAPHRATLHAKLVGMLRATKAPLDAMPERISVFGAPALPPAFIELFEALAYSSDVHLFVPDPCREYWGDIETEGKVARKTLAGSPDAVLTETRNSLLASLGKQGRDFIDLLHATESERTAQAEHFVEPQGITLLASVQRDVLELTERRAEGAPLGLRQDDRSLRVHSCHSAMREVEVLHDQLLELLETERGLEPSDMVVMTPDITTYAPYIDAVFGTAEPRIPYSISDRGAEQESTLAKTFMAFLELPGSRYDAMRVLGVLDEPAVQRRFRLRESDLDAVHRWVRDSGIRWGIDAAHRERLGLPSTTEHTWRFGLNRLLLGYALPGGGERLFNGVMPYDDVEGSAGALLGRFAAFAEAAIALDSDLTATRPVAKWCEAMHRLIATFFEPPEERSEELEAIRTCIGLLSREAEAAAFTAPVPLDVIVTAVRARLEPPGRAFLSGGVTFCAAVPMRSLPFGVVCMIGMNDRAFPRISRRDGFDLMASEFRPGDRSRREDDRYLFLESILSARRCLYLSYTGRHVREDTVIPPSVVVSELIEYINRNFIGEDGKAAGTRLVIQHPLQGFSRRYFAPRSPLFTYSKECADAANLAGRGAARTTPLLTEDLPEPPEAIRSVDLETLIRFFRNPSRHFLRTRLSVHIDTAEDEIETREPFSLGGLGLFGVKQHLMELAVRGEAHDPVALARASGVMPHGVIGEALFENERGVLERITGSAAPLLAAGPFEALPFELDVAGLTLTGSLKRVGRTGMLDYRPQKAGANLRVATWLRHLVLNLRAPQGVERTTRCVTQDCVLTFSPVADARERLAELVELYLEGSRRPLPFFPRTSCAYADRGGLDPTVQNTWRNRESNGEGEDPYLSIAFRGIDDPLDDEFVRLARAVFAPLKAALEEEPLS